MARLRTLQYLLLLLIVALAMVLLRPQQEDEPQCLVSTAVSRVLAEQGITIPLASISNVVERAIIQQIDPGSKFLDREQAVNMQEEWPAVEYSSEWPGGILYVKVLSINDGAFESITNAISTATNSLAGLVLDLRGAAGWSVSEIQKVAACAVPAGSRLCRIIDGDGEDGPTLISIGRRLLPEDMPIIVMVDKDTSGTAEILAGVLAGREDVLLMGTATLGNSCIREFVPLGSGDYLFIATGWADWGEGMHCAVNPDIVVEDDIHRQQVPEPRKVGRQSADSVELLNQTASDEVARRAADLILSRKRLKQRDAS